MSTKTFPSEEVAELFATTVEQLRNWRRLPAEHPRHLGATSVDGKYQYDAQTVIAWMQRPENASYREIVIASFVPDRIRDWFDPPTSGKTVSPLEPLRWFDSTSTSTNNGNPSP